MIAIQATILYFLIHEDFIQKNTYLLKNDKGLEKLDGLCMQLIAVGESIKNLDKITHRTLLKKYPEFEWKKAFEPYDLEHPKLAQFLAEGMKIFADKEIT